MDALKPTTLTPVTPSVVQSTDDATKTPYTAEPAFGEQPVDYSCGWLAGRPFPSADRLILPFTPSQWCDVGEGFYDKTVPPAMAARGVTQDYWSRMLDRIVKEVQVHSTTIACDVITYITCLPLPWLCSKFTKYNRAISRWLDDLNDDLASKGMFAKFQTMEVTHQSGENSTYHEEHSWLAVAIGPAAVQKMKAEPVVYTDVWCSDAMQPSSCQRTAWCCGPNRSI